MHVEEKNLVNLVEPAELGIVCKEREPSEWPKGPSLGGGGKTVCKDLTLKKPYHVEHTNGSTRGTCFCQAGLIRNLRRDVTLNALKHPFERHAHVRLGWSQGLEKLSH